MIYYWNKETNETTHLGAKKPTHWIEVKDQSGSELTYWWDPESNQTTPLGSPRPNNIDNIPGILLTNSSPISRHFTTQSNANPSFRQTMVTYASLGVGLTLGMTFVRFLFGF